MLRRFIEEIAQKRGRERIVFGTLDETVHDRILMDVAHVLPVIPCIFDPMFGEGRLPYLHGQSQFPLGAEGETAFDVLQAFLERVLVGGRYKQMEVIQHDDEFVDLEAAFGTVIAQDVDQQQGVALDLEERTASPGDGGDEEGADVLWGEDLHARDFAWGRNIGRGIFGVVRNS